MSTILRHNQHSLILHTTDACWTVRSASGARADRLRAGLTYSLEDRRITHSPEAWQVTAEERDHKQAAASWEAPGGLRIQIVFQLSGSSEPFLRWQMQVTNRGRLPVAINSLELMNGGQDGLPWLGPALEKPAFFSNGWQSWSYTGTYQPGETYRRTRLRPFIEPLLYDPAAPAPKRAGHFTSDMFGVLGCRSSRRGILAGFLSQQAQFGFVECAFDPLSFKAGTGTKRAALAPVLRLMAAGDDVTLAPGEQMTSDWACLQFIDIDSAQPLDQYMKSVGALHGLNEQGRRLSLPPEISPPDIGWCSWYHFYQNISAENLRENIKAAADLRADLKFDLFQIDDGFETLVGDWFQFRRGFPDGVAPLAAEIRQAGFMPGIWLAPFILQRSSAIAKAYPEWILRDQQGHMVNAGFGWNNLTCALDLSHPDALTYAAESVRTAVHEWGFDYIKLDFLYAGALAGRRHNPAKTRAQILRHALKALRDAAGERAIFLGCGCPLGSAIGLVDVMRIGPDVDQRWEPSLAPIYNLSKGVNHALFNPETNMPSARNAIHNIVTRLPMHQRWWINDPDCLLLRGTSELTLAETQTLATSIALSGGQFMISDDLPRLTPERLRIAQVMIPLLPEAAHAEDWFESRPPRRLRLALRGAVGEWSLLALFNWDDVPITEIFHPEPGRDSPDEKGLCFAHDFWNGEVIPLNNPATVTIPAHGVRLFSMRRTRSDLPAYLGSDLHIAQGLEVDMWNIHTTERGPVHMTLRTAAPISGRIALYLPWDTSAVRISGPTQSSSLSIQKGPASIVQVGVQCGSESTEIVIEPVDKS